MKSIKEILSKELFGLLYGSIIYFLMRREIEKMELEIEYFIALKYKKICLIILKRNEFK